MAKKRKPRKDGRYSINLSFLEREKELIDYVDSQGAGFSDYIKELIRKDMNKENITASQLLNLIAGGGIQVGAQSVAPQPPAPTEIKKEVAPVEAIEEVEEKEEEIKTVSIDFDTPDIGGVNGFLDMF